MSKICINLESVCMQCRCKIIRDAPSRRFCAPCVKIRVKQRAKKNKDKSKAASKKYYWKNKIIKEFYL